MLALDDGRWLGLTGGYRVAYDPRPALALLETGEVDRAWEELWDELHHQGDVGEASYAAVPHLVRIHEVRAQPDWNTYALVGTIEIERQHSRNPAMPNFLRESYDRSLQQLAQLALADLARSDDRALVTSAVGFLCLARGLRHAGRILLTFEDDELVEILDRFGSSAAG